MTPAAFYRIITMATDGLDGDGAKRATAAVFHALRDRLTVEEARQLAAQLPTPLRGIWHAGERVPRQPAKMKREAFYTRVMTEAELPSRREARAATRAVFAALQAQVSPGEADDVLAQLPKDLKSVWTGAAAA